MTADRRSSPRAAPDFLKLAAQLGEVAEQLSDVTDHLGKHDAQRAEDIKRTAALEAGQDTLRAALERSDLKRENTAAELIASQTNGYREFSRQLATVTEQMDRMQNQLETHTADQTKAATEGASSGVAKAMNADKESNRKAWTLGAILLGVPGAIGVATELGKAISWLLSVSHVKPGE